MLNNISIGLKLGVMTLILLALISLVGYFGVHGMKVEEKESKKLDYLLRLEKTLVEKEVDHLLWVSTMNNFYLTIMKHNLTSRRMNISVSWVNGLTIKKSRLRPSIMYMN